MLYVGHILEHSFRFFLSIMFFLFFLIFAHTLCANLTLDEKIGQLFIIPARSSFGEEHRADLIKVIQKYHVGGIILKQGDPESQINLINFLQRESKIPLLCVQDAEWGLAMRLSHTTRFPKNLTLGAIQDDHLIYLLGKEIGRECKKVGIHLNFAPVVDVNNNPLNPIIHMRSFGENPDNVSRKAIAYMNGLASEGILACAKHFPGHGDTSIDSHHDLPLITHSLDHLQKMELVPFKAVIDAGIPCIMSAHLAVPSLDPLLPASFSSQILTGLLRNQLHFKGLLISDALNMQALARYFSPAEIGLKALLAGHDLLLYGDHIAPNIDRILKHDIPLAFERIKTAIKEGTLSEEQLDAHVNKILKIKETLHYHPSTKNILEEINSPWSKQLKRLLFRNAITLVSDPQKILPLKETAPITLMTYGADRHFIPHASDDPCKSVALIIACYEKPSQELVKWIKKKQAELPVILVLFQSPYTLSLFPKDCTTIMAYENDPDAEEAAADLIFGRLVPKGKLPIVNRNKSEQESP